MNRRGIASNSIVFALLLTALLAAACVPIPGLGGPAASQATVPVPQTGGTSAGQPNANVTPSVTVEDQTYDGSSVVVADVVSKGPGWLAIHNQVNGAVGPVIGMAPLKDGDNKNVMVKVDPSQTTPTMYAMLHTDAGKVGTYEFPGPDIPVSLDGQMITPAFKATKQTAGSNVQPAVIVNNQVVQGGQITIAEVDSPSPGWVAIHVMSPDGTPGKDIGFSAVKPGKNTNVVVTVDQAQVTQTMFAMLHTDAGDVGMYEFPGPDMPVQLNGKIVSPAFATDGKTPAANANATMHDMSAQASTGPTATEPANEVYPTGTATEPANEVYPTATATAGMANMQPTAAGTQPSMIVQTPAPDIQPLVKVSDQPLNNGMVKVDDVVSGGPGWLVIYTTNASGQPDQAIGHTAVQKGDNKNVMVQVDPAKAQGKLYAQLHVDAGKVGTFEFPGPDLPLMTGVQMISGVFNVTAPVANNNPTATPAEGMVMPTAPAATQPGNSASGTVDFIKTADQPIINSTIVVPEVFSIGETWLVIHRVYGDGTEGPAVGWTRVKDGDNTNVVVRLDTTNTSSTMFAMLHEDKGKIGVLEFPGPDEPIMANGVMVNVPFKITGNKTADVVINLSKDTNTTTHLIDGYNMTLYLSLNDRPGQSNCTGDCLKVWKPLLANGRVVAGSGVASNKLGVMLLSDGSRQVTYAGAPLYTYTDDSRPGDINGQGLDGSWFLVTP